MRMHACGECRKMRLYERRNCDGGARPQPVMAGAPYEPAGWLAYGGQRGVEHWTQRYRPDLLDDDRRPVPRAHCWALDYQGRWDLAWISRVGLLLDNMCGSAVEWPAYALDLHARVKAERSADDDARQQHRDESP